mgnify:CR=1 FL=1
MVVGAGLTGLIAGSMLRDQVSRVIDGAATVPNNHSAWLRFRSSVVGDAVGIPFEKVDVIKSIDHPTNPVADVIQYSLKTTGKAQLRSITTAGPEVVQRYIAPQDFINRLATQLGPKLELGTYLVPSMLPDPEGEPIISTMPMPSLMAALGWEPKSKFTSIEGWTISCDLPKQFDICASLYIPNPNSLPYRVSITKRRLIIEISSCTDAAFTEGRKFQLAVLEAVDALGIAEYKGFIMEHAEVKPMKYAKINPIDEDERKRFILWATEEKGVYSLGRFATWRPGLLLDDIVNDVRMIQKMVAGDKSAQYSARKAQ